MRLERTGTTGRILFVTGTDTGVGKTLLTAMLLHSLRSSGVNALALKPFCSGSRSDVQLLQTLQPGLLSDSEVNPFFFRSPIAPLVAARRIALRVTLSQVIEHLIMMRVRAEVVLVEGAGGLLTPLGEGFSLLEVVAKFTDSRTVIVTRNRLGAINQARLTVDRLKQAGVNAVEVVLMSAGDSDPSMLTNPQTIRELIEPVAVRVVPFLGRSASRPTVLRGKCKNVKKTLAHLMEFAMNSARS